MRDELTCLGRDIKILHLVRDPIVRALSHHYHAVNYGMADPDAETALRDDPEFIAVSRYAMQLEAWCTKFPSAQIPVFIAEEYYASRQETVDEMCRFLGVGNNPMNHFGWHNRSEDHRAGRWNIVRRSRVCRRYIAPHLPTKVRARASSLLLSPGPPRPRVPSVDCLQRMRDALTHDVEALTRFMGRSTAPWDLSATVRHLAEGESARTKVGS